MNLKTSAEIFEKLESSRQKETFDEFLKKAVAYARIRTDWYSQTPDVRRAVDGTRTKAHDEFISACDAMALQMAEVGEDASWRIQLGKDRKVIGDFACYLHCILGIMNR